MSQKRKSNKILNYFSKKPRFQPVTKIEVKAPIELIDLTDSQSSEEASQQLLLSQDFSLKSSQHSLMEMSPRTSTPIGGHYSPLSPDIFENTFGELSSGEILAEFLRDETISFDSGLFDLDFDLTKDLCFNIASFLE